MTASKLKILAEQITRDCARLRDTKGSDYAELGDVFSAINKLSAIVNVPRRKVLWILVQKHLDALGKWANGCTLKSESVHSRVCDAINYLILLDGMNQDDSER